MNCVLILPTLSRYSTNFSRLCILLYKLGGTCQTGTDRGSTGPNHSSTTIFRLQTGLYWLKPCQSLSPLVRTVLLPFPSEHLDKLGVFILHSLSRWRHGRCRRRSRLPQYMTAFPVTPGCFKHFKTTRDMSLLNTLHSGSPMLSMLPPRL